MSIREKITLDDREYIASWKRVDKTVDRSASKHKRSMQSMERRLNSLKQARRQAHDDTEVKKYTKAIDKLESEMSQLRRETDRYDDTQKKTSKNAASGMKRIGMAARMWIAGVAFAAFQTLRKGLDMAQQIEASASRYETVLGPAIDRTNEYIEENARLMGQTNREAQDLIATTTAIAQGFGFVGDQAVDLGLEVVDLASDLQSFNNVPIEQTHRAITAALSGETESLKTLGIVIRQNDVIQQAMVETGKENADAITQQERAMATMSLITEKAGIAIGDLERTQRDADNRSRALMASIRGIGESMATRLNPALEWGLDVLEPIVASMKDYVDVPLSEELQMEQTQLNNLVNSITNANTSQERRNTLINRLQTDYPDFLENLDAETVSNEQLQEQLEKTNQKYVDRIIIQQQAEKVQEAARKQAEARTQLWEEETALNEKLSKVVNDLGLEVEFANKSTEERIAAVREALLVEAEFNEVVDDRGPRSEPLNEEAKAYNNLRSAGLGYARALAELREAEEKAVDIEQQRKDLLDSLGISMENATPDTDDLRNQQEVMEDTLNWMERILNMDFRTQTDTQPFADIVGARLGGDNMLIDEEGLQEESDILGAYLNQMEGSVANFQTKITTYTNQLYAGMIDEEEFDRKAEKLRQSTKDTVDFIYESLSKAGLLTPEIESRIEKVFELLEDGSKESQKEAKELGEELRDIADAIDAIGSMAGQIGALSDEMVRAIDHSADLVRNISKLTSMSSESGVLSYAVPAAGAIAGGIGLISSLFGNNDRSEEIKESMEELSQSLKDNARQISQSIRNLIEAERIGADVTEEQAETLQGILDNYGRSGADRDGSREDSRRNTRGPVTGLGAPVDGGGSRSYGPRGAPSLEQLQDAENTFNTLIDTMMQMGVISESTGNQFRQMYEDLLASGHNQVEAFNRLLSGEVEGMEIGLREMINTLSSELGEFAPTIEGAISKLEFFGNYISDDATEQFDIFMSHLLNNVDGFSEEMLGQMEQIQGLDITTAEGRRELQRLITEIAESGAFGGLSPNQVDMILNTLTGFADETAVETEEEEYARSVQISRAITEIQANEVVSLLNSLLIEARGMHNIMRSVAGMGSHNNSMAMQSSSLIVDDSGGAADIDINVGRLGVVTDEDIDTVIEEIRTRMKEELQYRAF